MPGLGSRYSGGHASGIGLQQSVCTKEYTFPMPVGATTRTSCPSKAFCGKRTYIGGWARVTNRTQQPGISPSVCPCNPHGRRLWRQRFNIQYGYIQDAWCIGLAYHLSKHYVPTRDKLRHSEPNLASSVDSLQTIVESEFAGQITAVVGHTKPHKGLF